MKPAQLRGLDLLVSSHRGYYLPVAVGADSGEAAVVEVEQPQPVADPFFTEVVNELVHGDSGEPYHGTDLKSPQSYIRGDRASRGSGEADTNIRGDDIGFDMSSVTPYLSAFAGGMSSGDKDKDKDKKDTSKNDVEAMKLKMEKEEAEKKASSRSTALWVTLGIVGTALVGTTVFFLARKKK